tara:strand:- start:18 stop:686 length:669 start_codon:yes stop_codon:yes gene_type:complete
MAIVGAAFGPNPSLQFQLVGLQTGGSYMFNADSDGKLDFISGTNMPFGIDVGTMAEFKCPVKITPGNGNIQLGGSLGDSGGSTSSSPGGDVIWVYGEPWNVSEQSDSIGWTLKEYIESYSSDIRLKTDISTIKNSLEKIHKLSGNTFKWKKNVMPGTLTRPGDLDIGVIAQEVQKVLPDAVTERNGYLNVAYHKLIPLLVEGIKDLSDQVDMLKTEIKELKG